MSESEILDMPSLEDLGNLSAIVQVFLAAIALFLTYKGAVWVFPRLKNLVRTARYESSSHTELTTESGDVIEVKNSGNTYYFTGSNQTIIIGDKIEDD